MQCNISDSGVYLSHHRQDILGDEFLCVHDYSKTFEQMLMGPHQSKVQLSYLKERDHILYTKPS